MAQTFRRYEKKYLLDRNQYEELLKELSPYIENDRFHECNIQSIYYDTDSYQTIRRSIEKPEYKEKLRIRSYGEPEDEDMVFIELKKKYDGVVYKRRTKGKYHDVLNDIYTCDFKDEQIGNEIRYALNTYDHLSPKIYINCKRASYVGKQDKNLRITFDKDIRYRFTNLSLKSSLEDKPVTDKIVMELKVSDALPLWLADIYAKVKVYPRGFSKVGTAFLNELKGGH